MTITLYTNTSIFVGIPAPVHALFCPGINLELISIDSKKQQEESRSPCTLVILERENASHHTASLAYRLVSELRKEHILGKGHIIK